MIELDELGSLHHTDLVPPSILCPINLHRKLLAQFDKHSEVEHPTRAE